MQISAKAKNHGQDPLKKRRQFCKW